MAEINFKEYYNIKRNNKIVGYIALLDKNAKEMYELSYFLEEDWHNCGIMTEELSNFLIRHNDCKIIAQVEKNNIASIRVLQKNNFFDITILGKIAIKDFDIETNSLYMHYVL